MYFLNPAQTSSSLSFSVLFLSFKSKPNFASLQNTAALQNSAVFTSHGRLPVISAGKEGCVSPPPTSEGFNFKQSMASSSSMATTAATTATAAATTSTPVEEQLKRDSGDVGWNYGQLVDLKNKDKIKCNFCGRVNTGGIYRLKQHVAQVQGNVKPCTKSTDEAKRI